MAIKCVVKLLASVGLLILLISAQAQSAEAANLYFSPSEGNYYHGENFTVSVLVDSDVSINAVSGTFIFPIDSVEVLSVNKTGSIINLWVRNPSFGNSDDFGNVNFEGVILNPGFTGTKGKILNVVFRVKNRASAANLNFAEFAVLANDGLGTIVASSIGEARFVFSEPPTLPKTEASQAEEQLKILKEIIEKATTETPATPAGIWAALPEWIKTTIVIFIGAAIIVFSAIIITFGLIILIWLWNYILRRKNDPLKWLESFFQTFGFLERKIEGDLTYGMSQIKKDIKEAKSPVSFREISKEYWMSMLKIIKRFFTINKEK